MTSADPLPITCRAMEALFNSRMQRAIAMSSGGDMPPGELPQVERSHSEPKPTGSSGRCTNAAKLTATTAPKAGKPAAARAASKAAGSSRASSQAPSRKAGDEEERTERAKGQVLAEFWAAQDKRPFWVVPMGKDSRFEQSCGMLQAILRARRLGRTPLLIDSSEHHAVDTFYKYHAPATIEGKALVLDERRGTRSRAQLLEESRAVLVGALRHGHTLYVRCCNAAPDFNEKYCEPTHFPLEVFDQRCVADLLARFAHAPAEGREGVNLLGADHPLAACLREGDAEHGVFVPRAGFEVVVGSHFQPNDAVGFLAPSLPLHLLQPVATLTAEQQLAGDAHSAALVGE